MFRECRLYRNNIEGEERYKTVFSESGAFHFDEGLPDQVKGINRIFSDEKIEMYDEYIFADIAVNKYPFIQADFIENDEEKNKSKNSCFTWENGRLYRYFLQNDMILKEEFMYIHLQKRKMRNYLQGEHNRYLISPNKFTPWIKITPSLLRKYNQDFYYYYVSIKFGRLKKKVEKKFSHFLNYYTNKRNKRKLI